MSYLMTQQDMVIAEKTWKDREEMQRCQLQTNLRQRSPTLGHTQNFQAVLRPRGGKLYLRKGALNQSFNFLAADLLEMTLRILKKGQRLVIAGGSDKSLRDKAMAATSDGITIDETLSSSHEESDS